MPVQLNYGYYQTRKIVGNRADSAYCDVLSYVNPLLPQIGTLTVGGTPADGVYSVTITPTDGGAPVTVSTTRAGGTPATNILIAAALNTAFNAQVSAYTIATSSNSGTAVNTVTFRRSGQTYTITTSAPAGATLVWAQTQAAGGSYMPVGRFVRRAVGAEKKLTPIIDGTTVGQLAGIVERTFSCIDGSFYGQNGEVYPAGFDVPVMQAGRIYMIAYQAMTPDDTLFCWIDPAATAVPVGGVVKSTDGGGLGSSGDAIDISSIARIKSVAAVGEIVEIEPFFGV